MKHKGKFSRREILAISGGGLFAMTFFPKTLLSAQNEIIAIRTGIQPGNKTRLVLETTQKPNYSLSYPNGQLVVSINAKCKAQPSMIEGTLINGIDIQPNKIVAHLKKTIAPISKDQILLLPPNGTTKHRLVLDFAAGSATDKSKAAATSAMAKNTPSRKPIIVIDPGHGGKDPGCIGGAGTREKDVVLSVSKKLYDKLNRAGYSVSLTRKNDTFLNLGTRAGIAQKKKADLFISIHANANPKKTVKGFSVYTLSENASDAEAKKLAEQENASDKIDVDGFERFEPEVRNLLSSLQQNKVREFSVEFAQRIRRAARDSKIDRVQKSRREAPFAVLKSQVPSALVELGHLSHRNEEKLLRSSAHQDKLAGALVTAIGNYNFDA